MAQKKTIRKTQEDAPSSRARRDVGFEKIEIERSDHQRERIAKIKADAQKLDKTAEILHNPYTDDQAGAAIDPDGGNKATQEPLQTVITKDDKDAETAPKEITNLFEGQLNRKAMAISLKGAMKELGLSQQKAADAAGTSKKQIQNIGSEAASIEAACDVLDQLGYTIDVHIKRKLG